MTTGQGDPDLPDCAADPADCGAGAYAAQDVGPTGAGLPDRVCVDAAAPVGGDGSLAKPLQSPAAAVALADQQTQVAVVAVAAGSCVGTLRFKRSLSVRGRCADKVRLSSPSGGVTVAVAGGSGVTVAVAGLGFRGPGAALQVAEGARLIASRIVVSKVEQTAVAAYDAGTQLSLSDVYIVDTQLEPSDPQGAVSVWAADGARIIALRTRVSRGRFAGLYATETSEIAARELIVDGTQMAVSIKSGMGLYANDGSTIRIVQGRIDKVRASGVSSTGGTVRMAGVRFDGSLGQPPIELLSGAVNVVDGGDVTPQIPHRNLPRASI